MGRARGQRLWKRSKAVCQDICGAINISHLLESEGQKQIGIRPAVTIAERILDMWCGFCRAFHLKEQEAQAQMRAGIGLIEHEGLLIAAQQSLVESRRIEADSEVNLTLGLLAVEHIPVSNDKQSADQKKRGENHNHNRLGYYPDSGR